MKVYIGADHRGIDFKSTIKTIVGELGYAVEDVGTNSTASCDYPVIAQKVARGVLSAEGSRGILVCMSGIGQSIAANKVDGIRAALCYNTEAARLSREHNNANVLVLSSKFVDPDELPELIRIWLTTPFEGGRHERRINLIRDMEQGKVLNSNP
ncbi:MAG: ribose 5-phosphate isomerase B [Candidatus Omnitrophica bacterium]|nr:ribose 5-phosphate isomerase B [Candidatus Omnitrophota bacterium]